MKVNKEFNKESLIKALCKELCSVKQFNLCGELVTPETVHHVENINLTEDEIKESVTYPFSTKARIGIKNEDGEILENKYQINGSFIIEEEHIRLDNNLFINKSF